jgi:cytochrome P450
MLSQIRWHQANAETNPFEYLNLVRKAVHWWNGRQMDKYISNELDKRYSEYKADRDGKRTKAVMDLVLQAYLPDDTKSMPDKLDPEFRAFAVSQIRLFVFVGHDSTSSTICYILHLLATHPNALARIREEHDNILGKELVDLPSLLKSQPHLTNDLPYTTAVIKESLRLFAPGGCSRAGKPGVVLIDDNGNRCPTEEAAAVFTIHTEMHRAPNYWKQPDEFLPERFLVEPGHELYPVTGAFRAFEIGPRNCVAQGFVMTELRVILACVVRQFDFHPAYDEWDKLHPSKSPRKYRGERVYQIEEGAAHPVEHYPCRVSVRA